MLVRTTISTSTSCVVKDAGTNIEQTDPTSTSASALTIRVVLRGSPQSSLEIPFAATTSFKRGRRNPGRDTNNLEER